MGDLMLVASELVTNAVRHSGGDEKDTLRIDVEFGSDRVRFAVCDPGVSEKAAEPRPEQPPFGGMGLRLVAQLSARWGAEKRPSGRHLVWAEIARPGTSAA